MKKNILVTGSHRSGTTWVGYVIAKSNRVGYANEPFNDGINRKKSLFIEKSPLIHGFEHVNGSSFVHQEEVKKYLNSFYKTPSFHDVKKLIQIRSIKQLYHYLRDIFIRIHSKRTVIKDPIAIMSAEWIYENFDIDVVVLIRHPAAFVASLKVKGWEFDFNHFLNQDVLMNSYLKNYKDEILDFSANKKDIIDQGILLWNIIYDVIAYYQGKYKDEWCFVKHEDLSLNPIVEFENIFAKNNLTLDKKIKKYIYKTTSSKINSAVQKQSTPASDVKRNSVDNIKTWKKRLSEAEILKIKKGTDHVWKKFYSEDDW